MVWDIQGRMKQFMVSKSKTNLRRRLRAQTRCSVGGKFSLKISILAFLGANCTNRCSQRTQLIHGDSLKGWGCFYGRMKKKKVDIWGTKCCCSVPELLVHFHLGLSKLKQHKSFHVCLKQIYTSSSFANRTEQHPWMESFIS